MEYLDSRDLEKELVELEEAKEDKEEFDEDRLKALQELKSACEHYGWDDGITFIPEVDFEDYARELAEDCGFLQGDNNPLMNHIDWSGWAKAVEMDYSNVTFEGKDYLYREA